MRRALALQANIVVTSIIYFGLLALAGMPVMILLYFIHPHPLASALGYAYDFVILLAFARLGNRYLPLPLMKKLLFAAFVVSGFALVNIAYSICYRQINAIIDSGPDSLQLLILGPLFVLQFVNWRLLFRWGLPEERQPV